MQKNLVVAFLSVSFCFATALAQQPEGKPKKLPKKRTNPPVEVIYGSGEQTVTSTPDTNPATGTPVYQFNTSGTPGATDDRGGMNFKVPLTTDEKSNNIMADPVKNTDDGGAFKTYIGYPKHQISLYYMPTTINSKWSYDATRQDFSFNSNSSDSVGLLYRFVPTPQVNVELDYAKYTVSTKAATVTPFDIKKSDTTVDTIWARLNYYFVNDSNFFFRYGPGIELGYDAYPILNFVNNTDLQMDKVKDFTLGVNFNLQYPLIQTFLLNLRVGYSTGTGAGNSGELTSKKNNSYSGLLGVEWSLTDHHGLSASVDYRDRQASIEGQRGNAKDEWDTKSTTTAFKLGYVYTF